VVYQSQYLPELLAHFSEGGRGVVAVTKADFYQAYIDESGTHAGASILAVAAYFGTHGQWEQFLSRWKHDDFHACESRYDKLKSELADAIDASEIEGAEVCIRPHEFQNSASADMKSNMGNAYAVGVFLCVVGICKLVSTENENARIAFVLEDGQPNVLWVQRLLIAFMAEYPTIASVTVAAKVGTPQFHPPDFLAYSRSTTDVPWMNRLFAKGRAREMPIEAELFSRTSEGVKRLMRENRRRKAKEKLARKIARKSEIGENNGEHL